MKPFKFNFPNIPALQETIRKATAPIREFMEKTRAIMAQVAEVASKLPDKTKRVLKNLAEKGWFLPLDITIPAVDHLAKLIESNDDEEIDRSLVEFYTEQLDEVLNNLVATFPERAHLFRSAFKAHNYKEYDLSIPVLLAQADGICCDMLGVDLFGRKNKIPKTKEALRKKIGDTPAGGIIDAFFEPLRSGSGFMLGTKEVEKIRKLNPTYNFPSRHMIMHGTETNYGNEINSLKAIAQLDYLRCMHKALKDHEKEQPPATLSPESQIAIRQTQ